MTDLALWEMWISNRDATAFQDIILRHTDMVYATCCRILRNRSEAEDVTQECFQKLAETKSGPTRHLAAWLHRVATNLCLNRIKSNARRKEREARFAADLESAATIGWKEIYGLVDEALLELPDHFQTPILAHFFEQQSQDSIAEAEGVSRQTITYRIAKGIEALREKLEKRGVGIAVAALTTSLGAYTAEAAPAALKASLAKIALSGIPRIGVTTAAGKTIARSLVAKLVAAALACITLTGLAVFYSRYSEDVKSQETTSTTSPKAPHGNHVSNEASPAAEEPAKTGSTASLKNAPPVAETPLIEGIVILSDGFPAAGAHVEVRKAFLEQRKLGILSSIGSFTPVFNPPDIVSSVTTDNSGVFTAGGLPAGERLLCVVSHPDGAYGGGFISELDSEERRQMSFRLLEPTAIGGTVVTESGIHVKDATVRLWGCYPEPKPMSYMREGGIHGEFYGGIAEVRTDDTGSFTFNGIPKEWWIEGVSAEAEGFAPSFGWDEASLAGLNGEIETPLLRPPFKPLKIALQIEITVNGRVTLDNGTPVADARVQLQGKLQNTAHVGLEYRVPYRKVSYTEAQGIFSMDAVHPTVFQLDAGKADLASDVLQFVPQSKQGLRDIALVLQPVASIAGTAVDADTGKPAAITIGADLMEREGRGLGGPEIKTDALGRFKFAHCRAGKWRLCASEVIVSASAGNPSIAGVLDVTLTPGQQITDLRLAMRSRERQACKLAVAVLDAANQPVAHANVAAAGCAAETNEQGEAFLEIPTPGPCPVTAMDPTSQACGTAEVEVAATKQVQVEVHLTQAACSVAGSIYTHDGKLYKEPINLRLWLGTGQQQVIAAKNGHYEVGPLVPGTHSISVESSDLSAIPRQHRGTLESGAHLEGLDFVIEPNNPIQGEVTVAVTYPDGRPAQGISLNLNGKDVNKQGSTNDAGQFKFSQVAGKLELEVAHASDPVWTALRFDADKTSYLQVVLKPLGKVVGKLITEDETIYPLNLQMRSESDGVGTEVNLNSALINVSLPPGIYRFYFIEHYQGPAETIDIRDVAVESNKTTDLGSVTVPLKNWN